MRNSPKKSAKSKPILVWALVAIGVFFILGVCALFNQTDMGRCTNHTLLIYTLDPTIPMSKNKIEYTKYKIDLYNVKIHDTGFKFGQSHICEITHKNQNYRLCFAYNAEMDSLNPFPCPGTNENVVEAGNAFMEYDRLMHPYAYGL